MCDLQMKNESEKQVSTCTKRLQSTPVHPERLQSTPETSLVPMETGFLSTRRIGPSVSLQTVTTQLSDESVPPRYKFLYEFMHAFIHSFM